MEQILKEYPQIEVVQIQFNYVDNNDITIQSEACYYVCHRYTYYGKSGNQLWNEFKVKLVAQPVELDEPNQSSPSEWAAEAIEWAKAKEISDGTRLKDTATREEIITMLWRALK